MRWKRRQSTWPAAAAMVALLLLTLAAPYAWKRARIARFEPIPVGGVPRVAVGGAQQPVQAASRADKPSAAASVATQVDPVGDLHASAGPSCTTPTPPPLPPLEDPDVAASRARYVRPGASHTTPNPELFASVAAPIVAGDDYAEDYSVVESTEDQEQPADVADDYIAVEDPPVAPLPVPALELPSEQSSTLPPLAAAPQQFDFSAWIGVRDALADLLGDAVEAAEEIEREAVAQIADNASEIADGAAEIARHTHRAVRVRVESSADRLAMVPEQSILIRPIEPPDSTLADPQSLVSVAPSLLVDSTTNAFSFRGTVAKPLRLAERPRPTPQPALAEHPNALISQLLVLRKSNAARAWSDAVLDEIGKLTTEPVGPVTAKAWSRLDQLLRRGARLAAAADQPRLTTEWVRSRQAVARRMPVWRLLADPAFRETTQQVAPSNGDATELTGALQEVAAVTAGAEMGPGWREYLLLDELAGLAAREPSGDPSELRETAQRVLTRMTDAQLTAGQREFLRTTPLRSLRRNLEPWAAGPVRLSTVAAVIERYENDGSMRYGRGLAQLLLRLRWSGVAAYADLADELEQRYRLPNLRLAVTDDLMNRLMPQPEATTLPVRDRVRGAEIRGQSETNTELSVHLLPADHAWRIVLGAEGDVRSRTYSNTWPARVRNSGRLEFEATKEIVLTPQGLSAKPAAAKVQGRNRLTGVESEFDPIPLLGSLARSIARQRHDRNRGPALAEVKSKVSRATRARIDAATEEKLANLEATFRRRVQAPLEQLAVSAEPVEMTTDSQRAVMRLRMAGEQQLSAHTPRPTAPSDSLISVQAHQSALNNALAGLGLAGRRMSALELYELFAKKLPGGDTPPPEDLPQRARIEFSRYDAIRVAYHNGRIELILSIAEMARGRDRIRNFEVHAFYIPQIDGLGVHLVRDGTLQFSGARLRTGPRVVLHSVFGKLLHKTNTIPVLAEGLATDPRFAGLMVTQLVIDDGWLAVALGPEHPERVAWRTRPLH